MKTMKKVICVVLAFVMLLIMTACGEKTTGGNGDNVTITWMLPIGELPDEEKVEAAINEIAIEEIGVAVDLVCIDGSAYTERMNMNMASGKDYDLCFTGYVNPYTKAVDNGGLLQLDDLLKEVPKLMESMPEYAWDVAKIKGGIYAVPNLQGFAPPTSVTFYKDLTEKYNFDARSIKHIEDCEPYFETLVANEPGIIPFWPNYGTTHWTDPVWEQINSLPLVIRRDGSSSKVEILYETEEYKRGINVLHSWYNKGILRADLVSAQSNSEDWKAGKIVANGSGWLPGSEEKNSQLYGREIITVPVVEPYMQKELCLAAMTGIGVNSKHPVESIKFIELVNTNADVLNLLTLGIKDVHYTLGEDGKYTLIPNSGWTTGGGWQFGNNFIQYVASGVADDVWEQTEKMNLEAIKSPLLGFVLDTEPIKTQISQLTAAEGEFGGGIEIVNNGADHEKRMKKLEAAGLYEIQAEVQRQIDEYWATR
ncbi:MAG: DUF3502 domain-containing protein [Clostridia bacterium]|nr:DUF3502 domain-containing protein [Clostridia bacterium]